MPRQKKPKKPKRLTQEEIRKLLERGAKSAAELDKQLRRVFTLTPEQRNFVLD